MQKDVQYVFIIGIVLYCGLFCYESLMTKPDTTVTKTDTVITIPQGSFDVLSKKEGTVFIHLESAIYRQMMMENGDKNVKYFVFFTSKLLPGLEVKYNVEEKVFESGIPAFRSANVDLFNGESHTLAFSYRLGDKQAIFLDGQLLGERPLLYLEGNVLSGFAIRGGEPNKIESTNLVSDIKITDQSLFD
jgi:hypothetical protein